MRVSSASAWSSKCECNATRLGLISLSSLESYIRDCSAHGDWDSNCLNHSGPRHHRWWSASWAGYNPHEAQYAGLSFPVTWWHELGQVRCKTSNTRFPTNVLNCCGSQHSHPKTMRPPVHEEVFSVGMRRILYMCFRRRATISAPQIPNTVLSWV